jgi:ADP-ribosylglycohydrolase
MLSDDTEHSLLLACSLHRRGTELEPLLRDFAGSLRWWFAALPAGVGLSTARAILKLWLGFSPLRSGVRSAGNGAAMRSAIIGVLFQDDEVQRRRIAKACCEVTHAHALAVESCWLVTEAAAGAARAESTERILELMRPLCESAEMQHRMLLLLEALRKQQGVADFADALGARSGISGFTCDTVSLALFGWLRHRGDARAALEQVIAIGGDTDTSAAICGALLGCDGAEFDATWVKGISDWPRSVSYLRQVAAAFDDRGELPMLHWWAVPLRNLFFLLVVLAHGLLRLVPRSVSFTK